MHQGLPKELRIRESSEIRRILTQGRKYSGTHLILFCLTSSSLDARSRAGFLSPKKIGKAVDRNRVRRWMRETLRRHYEEIKGSHQILMMGRTSAIQAGYQAIHDEFLELCRKARLLPSA
jgi:ribonuclease P protein component